jgi:hypothetical protein
MNRFKLLAMASICLALLTACASTSPDPTPSASVTPSPTPTVDPMTPAEAKAAYRLITQASCNAAQSLGVVESSENYTVVSVNKDEGYKDYSAAYLEKPDKYGVIWELTSITACADWFTFSMSDEAGQDAAIDVTFDAADSSYTTFEDFGDSGSANYKYTVVDGKLATATNLDPKNSSVTQIRYGNLTAKDLAILKTAVDEYLATL